MHRLCLSLLLGAVYLVKNGIIFSSAWATSVGSDSPAIFSELLLAVSINNSSTEEKAYLFLKDQNGKLLALEEDLKKWRLKPMKDCVVEYNGHKYRFLSDYKGLSYKINKPMMKMSMTLPSTSFEGQTFDMGKDGFVSPTLPSVGGYLDYDLLAEVESHLSQLSGLFSGVLFTPFGHGTWDFISRSTKIGGRSFENDYIRLNTAWRHDAPQGMCTFLAGDSYTTPGIWGRSVGFGGFQIGRNFATQPEFITFPLPNARGEATVPSTIDLFVNDARVGGQAVKSGPFSIDSIPTLTGGGEVNVVATDLLGRQQTLTIPYYVSDTLLKPGLHDYSIEGGYVRKKFGLKSNDYGRFAIVGFDRFGITKNFTGEIRGEFLRKQQAFGLGTTFLISKFGVISAAIAGSTKDNKQGLLTSLGVERRYNSGFSLGITNQSVTKNFEQLGIKSGCSPKNQLTCYIGSPPFYGGSCGITYTRQDYKEKDTVSLLGANYSQRIGKWASLGVSALTNIGGNKNQSIFATLTIPLGRRTSMNVTGRAESKASQGGLQVIQNLPAGNGFGYDVSVAYGLEDHEKAILSARTDYGTYKVTGARRNRQVGGRFEATGSAVFIDNRPYLRRSTGQSFAVVQVPGFSNVAIYEKNHLITHTDNEGNAFIPNLLPFQDNKIRIEPNDLPMNTEVPTIEMNAIPYRRTGLVIQFPIRKICSAVLTLIRPNGEFVPVGACVTRGDRETIVGNKGKVYLQELHNNTNEYQVSWPTGSCRFAITYKETDDPLPNYGKFICIE